MAKKINYKKVVAKITITEGLTWDFPLARVAIKNHYWAWVKFESDKNLKHGIWTLIIKPHQDLTCDQQEFLATVFFAAKNAPEEFLSEGNKFELFCGHVDNIKAKGEIVEIKNGEV